MKNLQPAELIRFSARLGTHLPVDDVLEGKLFPEDALFVMEHRKELCWFRLADGHACLFLFPARSRRGRQVFTTPPSRLLIPFPSPEFQHKIQWGGQVSYLILIFVVRVIVVRSTVISGCVRGTHIDDLRIEADKAFQINLI